MVRRVMVTTTKTHRGLRAARLEAPAHQTSIIILKILIPTQIQQQPTAKSSTSTSTSNKTTATRNNEINFFMIMP